jgi:nucleotidyltransferase substrate binding protein (TIGR01987 family)
MEQLNLKYDQSKKAIQSIKKLLEKIDELKEKNTIMELVTQEALIKRFEYSVDTLWKYLKLYLQIKHGIEQKSPKTVFKEALRIELISEEQAKQALEMVDDRNLTSHTYNEELAQEIVEAIPKHYKLMNEIIEDMTP